MLNFIKNAFETSPKSSIKLDGDYPIVNPTQISNPVEHGIDIYNRPFICFKLTTIRIQDEPEADLDQLPELRKNFTEQIVITLFQRYHDNPNQWAISGEQNILYTTNSWIEKEDIEWFTQRLKLLLNGDTLLSLDSLRITNKNDLIIGNGLVSITLSK